MSPSHKPSPPSAVAPGNHDGIHLGHQKLLETAMVAASKRDLKSTALFFDPHPVAFFAPDKAPTLLTTATRRKELLLNHGVDETIALSFDATFSRLSPFEFVEQVLTERLNTRVLVVGPDFRFGKDRSGDVETLKTLGPQHGFNVIEVSPVVAHGGRVSSTRIRNLIADGQVDIATQLLTRVHEIEGKVIEGNHRGRTIGFRTANISPKPTVIPGDGVYAIVARQTEPPSTITLHGVCNIGTRPTFGTGRSIEVHLFDFNESIYGHTIRVGFVERIRSEQRFDGIESLKAQIRKDVKKASKVLNTAERGLYRWV